jgi:hypothetical protein
MTMSNQPYTPEDLLRLYLRGTLDDHTLHTQIILILIDQAEVQRATHVLLDLMSEEMSQLALDIEALFNQLGLSRPSQNSEGPDDSEQDEAADETS